MCELSGIRDIVCKIHGTKNHQNVVRATLDGLQQLMSLDDYAKLRGKSAAEIVQARS